MIENVQVVGQAFTGEDAIEGIRKTKPDLVILDVMMPKGDGFCVLRSLQPRAESPLVVVLTFLSQESVRNACMELGAHVVYDKADAFHPLMKLLNSISSGETTHRSIQEPSIEQVLAV